MMMHLDGVVAGKNTPSRIFKLEKKREKQKRPSIANSREEIIEKQRNGRVTADELRLKRAC